MHRAYYKLHNEALGYMVNNLDRDVNQFFFPYSDALTPYAFAPPWTPLNPGFYSISWSPTHLLVLHDGPPWKVALCLPYPTVPSPPRHAGSESSVTLVRFSKVRPKMTRKMRTTIEVLTPH